MRKLAGVVAVMALVLLGCGGGDTSREGDGVAAGDSGSQTDSSQDPGPGDQESEGGVGTLDNPIPEASGALASNSLRIGDTTWVRTLPMTRGQCFLYEDDGTLPDSGTAWGSLNDDDNLSYSVNYHQDGSFEAQVSSDTMFWVSGQREGSELTITLDFATQTISGDGLFFNLHTGEWAYGSFEVTCEEGEG